MKTKTKVLLALATIVVAYYLIDSTSEQAVQKSMVESSVMITNLSKRSGGSGVTLSSSESYSVVLTNSHVCGVVVNGGLVTDSDFRELKVVSYTRSQRHDLCLIGVAGNLHHDTTISSTSPVPYVTESIVVGHPQLMPVIITKGYFSTPQLITVILGLRECSEAEKNDSSIGIICAFLGKLPILKTYDAYTTSALIQPGSSGSPVYNKKGELEALIFAGAGQLSYGYAVPYEYVVDFVTREIRTLVPTFVDYTMQFVGQDTPESAASLIKRKCSAVDLTPVQNKICSSYKNYIE